MRINLRVKSSNKNNHNKESGTKYKKSLNFKE